MREKRQSNQPRDEKIYNCHKTARVILTYQIRSDQIKSGQVSPCDTLDIVRYLSASYLLSDLFARCAAVIPTVIINASRMPPLSRTQLMYGVSRH